MNQNLHKLQQKGAQLYLRVIVTNVQSKVPLIIWSTNVNNYTFYFPTSISNILV